MFRYEVLLLFYYTFILFTLFIVSDKSRLQIRGLGETSQLYWPEEYKGLELENHNRMIRIFLLREYLFLILVFATILSIWCPASSVGKA